MVRGHTKNDKINTTEKCKHCIWLNYWSNTDATGAPRALLMVAMQQKPTALPPNIATLMWTCAMGAIAANEM